MLLHSERFYKLSELRIGGCCGCCGAKVSDCIVEKDWAVTICKKCLSGVKE